MIQEKQLQDQEDEEEVEKIEDHFIKTSDGSHEIKYLVKWKNHSPQSNSWEPRSNLVSILDGEEVINETLQKYEQEHHLKNCVQSKPTKIRKVNKEVKSNEEIKELNNDQNISNNKIEIENNQKQVQKIDGDLKHHQQKKVIVDLLTGKQEQKKSSENIKKNKAYDKEKSQSLLQTVINLRQVRGLQNSDVQTKIQQNNRLKKQGKRQIKAKAKPNSIVLQNIEQNGGLNESLPNQKQEKHNIILKTQELKLKHFEMKKQQEKSMQNESKQNDADPENFYTLEMICKMTKKIKFFLENNPLIQEHLTNKNKNSIMKGELHNQNGKTDQIPIPDSYQVFQNNDEVEKIIRFIYEDDDGNLQVKIQAEIEWKIREDGFKPLNSIVDTDQLVENGGKTAFKAYQSFIEKNIFNRLTKKCQINE